MSKEVSFKSIFAMTEKDAINELKNECHSVDGVYNHMWADYVLCAFLKEQGFHELVKEYVKVNNRESTDRDCVNFYSERARMAVEYEEWLKEHPEIKDCPLSVISFLEIKGALKNIRDIL